MKPKFHYQMQIVSRSECEFGGHKASATDRRSKAGRAFSGQGTELVATRIRERVSSSPGLEDVMDANDLLKIAREIIAKVPMCFAITVDQNGEANARVVQTAELSDQWTVRYTTDRRSRKVREIERSGKMT